MTLEDISQKALNAKTWAAKLDAVAKNALLRSAAHSLRENTPAILDANTQDIAQAKADHMNVGLLDRLMLNTGRIEAMAKGLEDVAALDDPIGEVTEMKKRPNGLLIGRKRVPLGVVGVIYEARPNVTADVFALTFKTGNAVILKGGKAAANSNLAIVKALKEGLATAGGNPDVISLIEDNSRETAKAFMRLTGVLDVLIPRGGKGLIQAAVQEATVPVIETGTGNCHIYVDERADLDMAVRIVENAKTQRIGVCNAAESLVVHRSVLQPFLKKLEPVLDKYGVQLRADTSALAALDHGVPAQESDWGQEYLDWILSVKTVDSIQEAIDHINRYSTGHSESIITDSYQAAQQFLNEVDSAAVYVNASTRFTDGAEFGFGAEIGISTQKLHARGPMGLEALTSSKYIIYGSGQIR